MNLDFRAIQALSSRTRLRILRELLRESTTAEGLKQSVDIAADQVVMHLETLENAGLVDTEPEEEGLGRVYTPTEKARAIVDGQERKVKFSMGTSMFASIAGAAMVGWQLVGTGATSQQFSQASAEAAQGAGGVDAANGGAPEAANGLMQLDPLLAVGAVLLFAVAVLVFLYGRTIKQLAK